MRVVIFCHSIVSDWNHGNAHFLRGVSAELKARGHEVVPFEPANGWSVQNLMAEYGPSPIHRFEAAFPHLRPVRYSPATLDLDAALDRADLVLVHEWTDPDLVRRIGQHRVRHGRYRLLFHDTHHRTVTRPDEMAAYPLDGFDGVLAFGEVIRQLYLGRGWAKRAWTWHEAADTRLFKPLREVEPHGDVVWIGNWGDDERTAELEEFFLGPVRALVLKARVHGVRYPPEALAALQAAGIEYLGWVPNFEVPSVFARFRATVHVPRRPYVEVLRGIPTIRVFEALACGIPLVSAPWDDVERLFRPGDFLVARTGEEMRRHLRALTHDGAMASELAARGLETIRARHTCAHRVDQLLSIYEQLTAHAAEGKGEDSL